MLAAAILVMARERVTAPERIHHVHMAGRGSTLRKLMLTAVARTLGCTHVLHLHDYDYADDYGRAAAAGSRRWSGGCSRAPTRSSCSAGGTGTLVTGTLGVEPRRVVVLPNCVPDPGPHPAAGEAARR